MTDKEYWKKYYLKNKEKILNKNRKWAKTSQGKKYRREYKRNRYHSDPEFRRKLLEYGGIWREKRKEE